MIIIHKNFINVFYNFELKNSCITTIRLTEYNNKNVKYSYNNIEQDENSVSENFIQSSGSNFLKNEIIFHQLLNQKLNIFMLNIYKWYLKIFDNQH